MASSMDMNGMNFNPDGRIMDTNELIRRRKKKGECVTCGNQTHQKHMFKLIPITNHEVLAGRCLLCHPQPSEHGHGHNHQSSRQGSSRQVQKGGGIASAALVSAPVRTMKTSDLDQYESNQRHSVGSSRHNNVGSSHSNPAQRSSEPTLHGAILAHHQPRGLSRTVPPVPPATMEGHGHNHHSSTRTGVSSRQVHKGGGVASSPLVSAPVRTMKTSDLDQYESNQRHSVGSSRHNNVGSSHSNPAQRSSEPTLHGAILASAAAKGMADRYRASHPRDRASAQDSNSNQQQQQHHNTSSRRVASNRMLDRGGALSASRSNLGGLKSNSRAESNRSVGSGHSGGGSHTSSSANSNSNSNSNRRVTDVVDTIRRSAGNTVAQEHSFRALSNLDMNDSDRHVVRENGGIDEILSAMRNASITDSADKHSAENQQYAQLQASSCRALWNLSSTEDNQQAIIDGGGIPVIVKALTSHADDADVQEKAIAALSNLCANPAAQKAIQESGAIEAVVSAMTNHCMDGSVQDKAGHMLCNLATTDVDIKEYIAAKGGLDALIIGMDMHPTNPIVQERGCRAIRNLCSQSEANKVQVGKSDGVDAIITAMQVHRGEAEIQLQGTWALANLAIHADNKPIIGDRGGVDVIVRAMWVNSDSALLQEWACRAIWTLSVDQVNKDLVVESGGINAVVNAMMAHTDVPAVQEKACGCLANLAANADDHKMKIVEAEGIDAIVMAMVLFSGEKRVQERAVGAIRKILCEENLDAMRAAGVGNLVEAAMEQFPDCCQSKGQDVLDMLN
eukprot:CAMPEP_0194396638 /NCGR_PEP_ID=MMETSP0174-20130528/125101_1 /TAXON_ID=216777 /ORGANISM="Proboscia alata, Strain PI-D3" /LENGTH=789 /DNA_ID=CAMNT_0039192729 /DNA_START=614 /DNA_END=2984 /DNA_ORIENTATION=+